MIPVLTDLLDRHVAERPDATAFVADRAAELEHILAHSGALERIAYLDAGEWPEHETPNRAAPDAVLAMFPTSGTTSKPELVVHLQRTLAFHALQTSRAYGFDMPGARLLAAVPFCGVFGLCSTLGAFAAGAPVVVMDAFDAGKAVELARRHAEMRRLRHRCRGYGKSK